VTRARSAIDVTPSTVVFQRPFVQLDRSDAEMAATWCQHRSSVHCRCQWRRRSGIARRTSATDRHSTSQKSPTEDRTNHVLNKCKFYRLLLTELARKVIRSIVSVRPSVSSLSFETNNLNISKHMDHNRSFPEIENKGHWSRSKINAKCVCYTAAQ